MAKYYEIPDNVVDEILATDFSGLATDEDLATLAASLSGTDLSAIPQALVSIDALGNAIIPRTGRIQAIKLDTFGGSAADTLESVSTATVDPFQDFDIVYFVAESEARTVACQPSTGFNLPSNIILATSADFISMMRRNGAWQYLNSSPSPIVIASRITAEKYSPALYTNGGGVTALPLVGSVASIISLRAGETAATGTDQITATGTAGSVLITANEGAGQFTLAYYSYTGSPTVGAVAAGLQADGAARKLAGEHNYVFAVATDTVTVTVPSGNGVNGNAILLESVTTGGAATTTVSFAGGIDGTDQDEIIQAIDNGAIGQIYYLKNAMAANTLTFALASGFNRQVILAAEEWATVHFDGTYFDVITP